MASVVSVDGENKLQDNDDSDKKTWTNISAVGLKNGISNGCRFREKSALVIDAKRSKSINGLRVNGLSKLSIDANTPTLRSRVPRGPDSPRKRRSPRIDRVEHPVSSGVECCRLMSTTMCSGYSTNNNHKLVMMCTGATRHAVHKPASYERSISAGPNSADTKMKRPSVNGMKPTPCSVVLNGIDGSLCKRVSGGPGQNGCIVSLIPATCSVNPPATQTVSLSGASLNASLHTPQDKPVLSPSSHNIPAGQTNNGPLSGTSNTTNCDCICKPTSGNFSTPVDCICKPTSGTFSTPVTSCLGVTGATAAAVSLAGDAITVSQPVISSCGGVNTTCSASSFTSISAIPSASSLTSLWLPPQDHPRTAAIRTLQRSQSAASNLSQQSDSCRSQQSDSGPSEACQEVTPTLQCRWAGCLVELEAGGLGTHLQEKHVTSQKGRFACQWKGCKVFNKPSSLKSWLERHILSHSGDKPFRCIVEGCGLSFTTPGGLERHVPTHFTCRGTGRPVRRDDTPTKSQKRSKKARRKRPLPVRHDDYMDLRTFDRLRQLLHSHTPNLNQSGTSFTFHSTVIGRRQGKSGTNEVLLRWHPINICPDEWVDETEASELHSREVPLSSLPQCIVQQLCPGMCNPLRHRKQPRK